MADPRQMANMLLRDYKLLQPSLEDVVFLVNENGYEIIDFEPGSPDDKDLFQELALPEKVYSQDAFLYTNHDVKLLFIKDSLDAEEKRLAATHELGHIVCGHTQTKPSVKEEYEANEYVHYFLNPPQRLRIRNSAARHKWRTVAIIIAVTIILTGGKYAYDSLMNQRFTQYYVTSFGKKYHVKNCTQIRGKTNIRRLSREELSTGDYEPCETCLRDLSRADFSN